VLQLVDVQVNKTTRSAIARSDSKGDLAAHLRNNRLTHDTLAFMPIWNPSVDLTLRLTAGQPTWGPKPQLWEGPGPWQKAYVVFGALARCRLSDERATMLR